MYVIIGSQGNIERQVAKAMAPFDEALAVSRYKFHLHDSAVRALAKHYGIPRNDLKSLAKRLPEKLGNSGGVDAMGLFAWESSNPRGKWDWYIIGGRWDGYVHGDPTNHDSFDGQRSEKNVLTAMELLSAGLDDRLPDGIVTPTGQWVTNSEMRYDSLGIYEWHESRAAWRRQVQRILRNCPKNRVVCVDIHA